MSEMTEDDLIGLIVLVGAVICAGLLMLFVYNLSIDSCRQTAEFVGAEDWIHPPMSGCRIMLNGTYYHICDGVLSTEVCPDD